MINYQLWDLFGPATWPLWLLLFGAAHFIGADRRGPRHRRGRLLTLAAAGLALAVGATPLGSWLIEPLEQRFPSAKIERPPATILVLGGAENLAASEWRHQLELNDAGERVLEGAALAHRFPEAKLSIAGGIRLRKSDLSDVGLVKDAWTRIGISPGRIIPSTAPSTPVRTHLVQGGLRARSCSSRRRRICRVRSPASAPPGSSLSPTRSISARSGPAGPSGEFRATTSASISRSTNGSASPGIACAGADARALSRAFGRSRPS